MSKMQHKGMRYLKSEIKKKRKHYDMALNEYKTMDSLTHARYLDVLRWFDRRIEVAKLIDKEERQKEKQDGK